MNSKWKISILSSFYLIIFTSCNFSNKSADDNQVALDSLLGSNIYEAQSNFTSKGVTVSEIVDPTGKGELLLMSIKLRDKTFTDNFGYITGIDLKPWKKNEKSHIIIEANPEGSINKVEAR